MADVEKLRKEMDRKTKSYEGKLATLTAINSALQTENDKLRKHLTEAAKPTNATDAEVAELREEFARRLGAADRQIAQLHDDKERLRQQLQLASQGGSASEARLQEKDGHIRSLQAEGEKLSRRNGELEATIRKLRTQLKDVEAERDRLSTRLASAETQLEEKAQRANQAEQALAEQASAHASELQELQRTAEQRMNALEQQAHDEAHRSLEQVAKESADALAASMEREAALSLNISELRSALDGREEREADLRGEMADLENRVRELEAVNQALQANTTDATRPLLRQIESLAAAASVQQAAARETEYHLTRRVRECEMQLAAAAETQRAAVARAEAAEVAAGAARDAAHSAAAAVAEVKVQYEVEQARCASLQQQLSWLQEQLTAAAEASSRLLADKEEQLQLLQERLWDAGEQLRSIAAQRVQEAQPQQQPSRQPSAALVAETMRPNGGLQPSMNGSRQQLDPSGWQGGDSMPGMANGSRGSQLAEEAQQDQNSWQDSEKENNGGKAEQEGSLVGPIAVGGGDEMDEMLQSISLHSAPTIPLSSQKSIEGDKGGSRGRYLEAQVAMLERAGATANEALVQALARVQQLEADSKRLTALKRQLEALQSEHSLLLEVLGERNERVEQLEEDVKDMKRIFHEQLNVAVDQLHVARDELERTRRSRSTPAALSTEG